MRDKSTELLVKIIYIIYNIKLQILWYVSEDSAVRGPPEIQS